MDKVLTSLDKFITQNFAKFITNKPRWSALIFVIIILLALAGWITAIHYQRLTQLLAIPSPPVSTPAAATGTGGLGIAKSGGGR